MASKFETRVLAELADIRAELSGKPAAPAAAATPSASAVAPRAAAPAAATSPDVEPGVKPRRPRPPKVQEASSVKPRRPRAG